MLKIFKSKMSMTMIVAVIAILVAAGILGYYVWKGMQKEVFVYYPGSGITSLSDAKKVSLPNGASMATTSQLTDALNAGATFCMYAWASDDSDNVYLVNAGLASGSGCGTQGSLNQTPISASPSGASAYGIACYGVKPSPSGNCSGSSAGGSSCKGTYPWIFGGSLNQQWSQYSPRLSI